ncbi:hypothetical protein MYSTI_01671 [Myxococcus stipitatus DSM 14675]|uniref:DUF4340 domain-containing protein n=1 Tax=Myxococcus stipitatus (strain DSM 14675 / JCM 12634 / Mx s8) TaxID=1278073 RepID=L7U4C6_MYXSD|nr:hypothetical protein [Myxococcus stipitatus]AGC43003.1 hypothetical protein MYSTI_01671 [Myxococcus stipitatus DSM 14675]
MKARDLALQGALAAVALVAAYLVWQRAPSGAPGDVTVVELPSRALDRVRFEDEARFVELFRDDKDRDLLWVRLGFKPAKPMAPEATDGGAAAGDGGAVAAVAPPPPRELRANEVAQKLFPRFAPLRATRSLGVLDAKKLEEVGLTTSQRKLTMTLGGKVESFALASTTGGWGTPYLRRESDGHVFLLGPALLPDLENASSRLVDRRMHLFDVGDFDAVVISSGGVSRSFAASGKAPHPVALAPEESPDKPDEFTRNWHDRVWRLVPLDLLGRDEQPAGGAPTESFRVEYKRGGKALGQLTVARGAEGFFARTEHTSGWVRLPAGVDPLASEVARVTTPVSSAGGP